MPLDASIISLIRDEIGDDTDFVNNESEETAASIDSLESIYTDPNRGNENILITALIVWRRRLANMNARAFDVTKEGAWLARSQRVRYLKSMVRKYESMVGDKPRSKNSRALTEAAIKEISPTYYD